MSEMTDDELIGYCEIHCETPRALFHFGHINRMIKLAGFPENYPRELDGSIEWYSMHEDMSYLCEQARQRTKQ